MLSLTQITWKHYVHEGTFVFCFKSRNKPKSCKMHHNNDSVAHERAQLSAKKFAHAYFPFCAIYVCLFCSLIFEDAILFVGYVLQAYHVELLISFQILYCYLLRSSDRHIEIHDLFDQRNEYNLLSFSVTAMSLPAIDSAP